MAYVPDHRTISVDMSKLSAPVTARWYDPASGTWTQIPGSPLRESGTHPFQTPAKNSDGDEDWVLVLKSAATD